MCMYEETGKGVVSFRREQFLVVETFLFFCNWFMFVNRAF